MIDVFMLDYFKVAAGKGGANLNYFILLGSSINP